MLTTVGTSIPRLHICPSCDGLSHYSQVALQRNVDVSRLTLREIGEGLYGRPVVQNGGPTHFEMLPVLAKTDTKSYEDWHRTAGHLDDHCEPDVHVKLAWTDGQGTITGAFCNSMCQP